MRSLLGIALVLAACGGKHGGTSICEGQVPPPAACMTSCDPSPGAADTCPAGYHCSPGGTCDAECTVNGGQCGNGYVCTTDGQCQPTTPGCTGLQCQVASCESMGMPPTTISGTVFAPNGTLPLYGVNVYVPNADPGPLPDGATCDRCADALPGDPVAQTQSDEAGHFQLVDAPSGDNIPLVIVSGKWRRQITIPHVAQCADTPLTADDTRLPKNAMEGDLPHIAISTGSADALECLVRKLGIDDREISTGGQPGHIHLYTDGASGGVGASKFAAGFAGGNGSFADSSTLWDTVDHLKPYDIVILSCEGAQYANTKPQSAMQALHDYADLGGRVFASHWQNIWIGGEQGNAAHGMADWEAVAQFNFGDNPSPDTLTATIDEAGNPKGASFATWMLNVMGSTTRDQLQVTQARTTCTSVDTSKGERWVYLDPATSPGYASAMNFQFTTPQSVAPEQRCGKVVFSDMHVSADSTSKASVGYPGGCATSGLTPQEKALAFMFFDLASCVNTTIP